jgi:ribose 5-phosphate isomerase B
MKIYLGADHAGFNMKEHVKAFLTEECGYTVEDKGAITLDSTDDYPDFVGPVACAVASDRDRGEDSFGIVFGGSGQGEAMVVNRTKGVRCAVYYGGPREIVTLSREHNDANILSLGARFVFLDQVNDIVHLWLTTKFSGDERHVRRIAKF